MSRWNRKRYPNSIGFTILELVLAMSIIAVLGILVSTGVYSVIDRIKINNAQVDIYTIEVMITRYQSNNGELPMSLDETEAVGMIDPWERPYQFTNLADAPKTKKGKPKVEHRKDKFLHPLNSDYDLYSKGKDGRSVAPLTSKLSRDDIIRANNGAFVGLAYQY